MSRSLADAHEEQVRKHHADKWPTYDDYQVGDKVRVITPCEDFRFFRMTETGTVARNTKQYLGIQVTFDTPLEYEGDPPTIITTWNFKPESLVKLSVQSKKYADILFQLRNIVKNEVDRDLFNCELQAIKEAIIILENLNHG